MGEGRSRAGADIGGTFTDVVALDARGSIAVRKVVTTPDDPTEGLIAALAALDPGLDRATAAATGESAPRPPRPPQPPQPPQPRRGAIEVLVHGTTIATNALLERRGARVVLVTTRGFEDLLWLRRQDRAALYDLARDHPAPLVAAPDVVGVAERIGAAAVLEPLEEAEIARVVARVRALAPEAVAVALLFSFRDPTHERRLAAALRQALPGVPVAASHEVLPVFREFERTSTTTVEAYLRPKVSAYLERVEERLDGHGIGALRVMTSSGGTRAPAAASGHAAGLALSGPVGGVIGAQLVGTAVGLANLLTLDMGGTSADASLIADGTPLSDGAGAVAGIPLALPAVLIETVSAGGGSIARVDEGGALRVGPESAGAAPGPACYGRGGERPTVTDACLVLGWLDAATPLADVVRLDLAAATRALGRLGPSAGSDPTAIAAGIVAVATAAMARALKRVSVARGLDPRVMALLPFGGAGPLFGCRLADALGMDTIVIPPHPGALSALGLAAAPERVDLLRAFHRPLELLERETLGRAFQPLVKEAGRQLPGATVERYADCRFAGQGYEVTVLAPNDDPATVGEAFRSAHRRRYGHLGAGGGIELVNLRVVAVRAPPPLELAEAERRDRPGRRPTGHRPMVVGARPLTGTVWALDDLAPGLTIPGPAVLAGRDATALIEPGWRGTVHRTGAVLVARA